jgi:hypothetical protein
MIESIQNALSNGWYLLSWLMLVIVSLFILVCDLRTSNSHIGSLMQAVWFLTVLYSGPIGLSLYYISGRRQIRRDSIWRKGIRSVTHCYSGCGAGEVTGVLIAAGLLNLGNTAVAISTFCFAYFFGYGMTLGPLLQAGVSLKRALIDTFYADTLTIAVMELTAISLDLWLAANASMNQVLFWGSLILSLTAGQLAAYPVNVLLVVLGVKQGMGDPRETDSHGHSHAH